MFFFQITFVSYVGGHDNKNKVFAAWAKVVTDACARHLNWTGRARKNQDTDTVKLGVDGTEFANCIQGKSFMIYNKYDLQFVFFFSRDPKSSFRKYPY